MKRNLEILIVMIVLLLASLVIPNGASAGVGSKVFNETAEWLMRRGGKKVAGESAETLVKKMASVAAHHSDDLIVATAFKRVGPRAGKIASEAGEHGGVALRLLAAHGDDALPLVTKSTALKAIASYGDDAATAILKHGSVGEQLVGKFAKEGAEALVKVTPQNGRRLAMMAAENQLKPELMTVVTRYGDAACDFIWRHKGSLATAAVLATFVASPEPYLQGTQQLVSTVAEAAVKPLADVPKIVAAEAAARTNWTPIVVGLLIVTGVAGWRWSSRIQTVVAGSKGERPPKDGPPWPRRDN